MRSLAIDVHTHMLHRQWLDLLKRNGGPRYSVAPVGALEDVIHINGVPFMTPLPEMFDYDLRIRNMDRAGVDLAVVSLTCPNVYWGDAATSLLAARILNDDMAAAQGAYPDRIRWFASIPWQHPRLALEELERARRAGAVGVMVLANVDGRPLTDSSFSSIWKAIDDASLPVLVHPTAPPGVRDMDLSKHNLVPPVGFIFDTTLALARMFYDGFLDRYPKVKLIAAHGGGALPYIIGRLDICHEKIPTCRARTDVAPGEYLRRIHVDSVVFRQDALELALAVFGPENLLYGSDYPHNIGDMAGCLSRVDALASDVRNRVRGGNARRLFGI
jgi:aminocarboxymuconate-semialdehyde decarboxylase